MRKISIIEAPSNLGLRPTGVEKGSDALIKAGLIRKLKCEYNGIIEPPLYYSIRDFDTGILNLLAIRNYSIDLANKVEGVIRQDKFPLILGGDCSILIGCMLGLKRINNYGLFFLDGHSDYYKPEESLTGEVADMELRIITGDGPEILTNIEGRKPLVNKKYLVVLGTRDKEDMEKDGAEGLPKTGIFIAGADFLKSAHSMQMVTLKIQEVFMINNLGQCGGYWVHLDVDILDYKEMPAVDYRLDKTGLSFKELTEILKVLLTDELAVGMDVTIFNPKLDPSGKLAKKLASMITRGFKGLKI